MGQFGLPAYYAGGLTSDHELAGYFEACVEHFAQHKQVSNWIMGPLLGLLNAKSIAIDRSAIPAPQNWRACSIWSTTAPSAPKMAIRSSMR